MTRLHPLLFITLLAAACGRDPSPPRPMEHPAELAGRWVRLRADSTWGDTLEYLADGRVRGSTGQPVPESARWGVQEGPGGTRELCAWDEKNAYCQTFRFEGPVLVAGGGPDGPSYFRRAR